MSTMAWNTSDATEVYKVLHRHLSVVLCIVGDRNKSLLDYFLGVVLVVVEAVYMVHWQRVF